MCNLAAMSFTFVFITIFNLNASNEQIWSGKPCLEWGRLLFLRFTLTMSATDLPKIRPGDFRQRTYFLSFLSITRLQDANHFISSSKSFNLRIYKFCYSLIFLQLKTRINIRKNQFLYSMLGCCNKCSGD